MALHTIVEHDTTHIKPYVDKVKQALSDEVETRAALGAHNLLNVTAESFTSGTLSFTVNRDSRGGIVSLVWNGSYSGSGRYFKQLCPPFVLPAGNYKLTGAKDAYTTIEMTGIVASDTGSGATFVSDGSTPITIYAVIYNNREYTNAAIYPMIRLISDTDPTYRPYAMTNRELTDGITPLLPKSSGKGTVVVTPETGWNCSDVVVERSGNVVHIGGFASYNSDIPSSGTICTLKDTSIAPKVLERVISGCGTDAWKTYQPCYMVINTSGNIFFELPTGTSADNVNFNFTYII